MGNFKRDSLGDRMKENYENRSKTKLVRRMPVIIRLDGKAFHTFTRGFEKPFDKRLMEAMQETTLELCKNIQGCVFGYTQSDEITLVLVDYNDIDTSAWFDYEVQKLCSVVASMCTLYFNRIFREKVSEFIDSETWNQTMEDVDLYKLVNSYNLSLSCGAVFDARAFNIPKEEVVNCCLWRQQDCTRNSIFSLAQAYFSHGELHGKSSSEMQDMLMGKYNINWNDLSICEKRGTAVIRDDDGHWKIDKEMPILKGEDRNYLEKKIIFLEE